MKKNKFILIKNLLIYQITSYIRFSEKFMKIPFSGRVIEYENFNKLNFNLKFIHEKGININLKRISFKKLFFDKSENKLLQNYTYFIARINNEVLLRKIIFFLYDTNFIDPEKSIIDIGCWKGDNTLVWSKFLQGEGIVYGIDPSQENLDFAKDIAHHNEIKNIEWIKAVCSDQMNQKLYFEGELTHARFKLSNNRKECIYSQTIDNLVKKNIGSIGFFHIDVEGFELNVIKGAKKTIENSRPVIVFEQHISSEDIFPLVTYLKKLDYEIFMINEVPKNCDLDCRNFIAINSNKKLLDFDMKIQKKWVSKATVGALLIKI